MTSKSSFHYSELMAIQARIRKKFSACSVAVKCGNKRGYIHVGRHANMQYKEPHSIKLGVNSQFDVASVTKAIPVSLLVLWAITVGLISLETEIRKILPGVKTLGSKQLTVHDLLRYSCKFNLKHLSKPYERFDSSYLLNEICNSEVSLTEELNYGNYQPVLLAMVLEEITGKKVADLAKEVLFEPLGMNNTSFAVDRDRFVLNEVLPDGNLNYGVHDEITRALGFVGSAGLFSTSADLLKCLEFLLHKGSIDGKQIIDQSLIDFFNINQFQTGQAFGLGFGLWETFSKGYEGAGSRAWEKGAFFKLGYTGCGIFVFPAVESAIVILSNHVHPVRPNDHKWINLFRYLLICNMFAEHDDFSQQATELWV